MYEGENHEKYALRNNLQGERETPSCKEMEKRKKVHRAKVAG